MISQLKSPPAELSEASTHFRMRQKAIQSRCEAGPTIRGNSPQHAEKMKVLVKELEAAIKEARHRPIRHGLTLIPSRRANAAVVAEPSHAPCAMRSASEREESKDAIDSVSRSRQRERALPSVPSS